MNVFLASSESGLASFEALIAAHALRLNPQSSSADLLK